MAQRKSRGREFFLNAVSRAKSPVRKLDEIDHPYSDSETAYPTDYYQFSSSLPTSHSAMTELMYKMRGNEDNMTDDENQRSLSTDEFGDNVNFSSRLVRTGRQRKKLAARSKGGEFQTRRKKKRVYFCCISSEVDVEKLSDHIGTANDGFLKGWKWHLYNEVLHLYKVGTAEEPQMGSTQREIPNATNQRQPAAFGNSRGAMHRGGDDSTVTSPMHHSSDRRGADLSYGSDFEVAPTPLVYTIDESLRPPRKSYDPHVKTSVSDEHDGREGDRRDKSLTMPGQDPEVIDHVDPGDTFRISAHGAQEIFVFDFGAVVFWGFPRGEEVKFLDLIRQFITRGLVGPNEFPYGVDDMAFVTTPDAAGISIANDVITLADDCVPKQRLSISFAIAQSSVLAIFEARVESRVEEYKYIPEELAAHGKVHLSERRLGTMIGEVFVIRHDVNLHTEILDIPDFFWKQEMFEKDYMMVMSYLEMSGRTEILNKRLDMLRELLDVLQQQMENAHAVKLEWIVIYLIIAEVILQSLAVLGHQ